MAHLDIVGQELNEVIEGLVARQFVRHQVDKRVELFLVEPTFYVFGLFPYFLASCEKKICMF
jgi:hypothetical protein